MTSQATPVASQIWNRLSYRRWLGLEDSIRKGKGVAGEFNFTAEEQTIFSEGVEVLLCRSRRGFGGHVRLQPAPAGAGPWRRDWFLPESNIAAVSGVAMHVVRTANRCCGRAPKTGG